MEEIALIGLLSNPISVLAAFGVWVLLGLLANKSDNEIVPGILNLLGALITIAAAVVCGFIYLFSM